MIMNLYEILKWNNGSNLESERIMQWNKSLKWNEPWVKYPKSKKD